MYYLSIYLTEILVVYDLIERGTPEENADGTLSLPAALTKYQQKFKSETFSNNINSARLQMLENL